MNMIVCVKQTPSTNRVQLDPETHTIIRDGRQSVINPFDTYALEEALRLKERLGGQVAVMSMGIPAAARLLREAISQGADRGLLLSDRAFAGADTLATAYALALGARHIGDFDLILCGKMAIDGDTAQIGPELAENLGIPHIANVTEILECGKTEIVCRKKTDYGTRVLRMKLPGLITVDKGINEPRMASIAGVRASLAAPLEVVNAAQLGADPARTGLKGSPTQVLRTFAPEREGQCVRLPGDEDQAAQALLALIQEKQGAQRKGEDA